jgi:hypothetical protein
MALSERGAVLTVRQQFALVAIFGLGVVGFALAGAVATGAADTTTDTTTTGPTTTASSTGPTLPRPSFTPGALNRAVRQSTIRKTICKRGWTKKIRPPVSYTNALKLEQMALYGETGSPSDYEEDHLIPLELGGAPRNPRNLWPEPRAQSKVCDPFETELKRAVCYRVLSLTKARLTIRAFKFSQG